MWNWARRCSPYTLVFPDLERGYHAIDASFPALRIAKGTIDQNYAQFIGGENEGVIAALVAADWIARVKNEVTHVYVYTGTDDGEQVARLSMEESLAWNGKPKWIVSFNGSNEYVRRYRK